MAEKQVAEGAGDGLRTRAGDAPVVGSPSSRLQHRPSHSDVCRACVVTSGTSRSPPYMPRMVSASRTRTSRALCSRSSLDSFRPFGDAAGCALVSARRINFGARFHVRGRESHLGPNLHNLPTVQPAAMHESSHHYQARARRHDPRARSPRARAY